MKTPRGPAVAALTWRAPAGDSDLELLARLNQQLIRDEGHRNPMGLVQLRDRMAGWLASGYEAAIFCADGAETAAYALWAPRADHLYLRQFCVVPEFRRRGVGRTAFRILKDDIWPKGSRLRVDVLSGNLGAIEFWKAVGFEAYALVMEQGPGA